MHTTVPTLGWDEIPFTRENLHTVDISSTNYTYIPRLVNLVYLISGGLILDPFMHLKGSLFLPFVWQETAFMSIFQKPSKRCTGMIRVMIPLHEIQNNTTICSSCVDQTEALYTVQIVQ